MRPPAPAAPDCPPGGHGTELQNTSPYTSIWLVGSSTKGPKPETVGVGVGDTIGVAVLVGVTLGAGVDVLVGITVGVVVGVGVGVAIGVDDGAGVGDTCGVGDTVAVGVGDG